MSVLVDKVSEASTITSQRVLVIPPQFYDALKKGINIRIEEDESPEWIKSVSPDRFKITTLREELSGNVFPIIERVYEKRAEVKDLGVIYGEVSREKHLPLSGKYLLFKKMMEMGACG